MMKDESSVNYIVHCVLRIPRLGTISIVYKSFIVHCALCVMCRVLSIMFYIIRFVWKRTDQAPFNLRRKLNRTMHHKSLVTHRAALNAYHVSYIVRIAQPLTRAM